MLLTLPVHLRPSIFAIRILNNRVVVSRPRPAPPAKAPTRGELLEKRRAVRDRLDALRLSEVQGGALFFGQPFDLASDLDRELRDLDEKLETVK